MYIHVPTSCLHYNTMPSLKHWQTCWIWFEGVRRSDLFVIEDILSMLTNTNSRPQLGLYDPDAAAAKAIDGVKVKKSRDTDN